ncbi:hypothetical protein [Natronococcus occultus]|uniref:Uncharacterized protein n=1 Tax=Natronococcus occultus SP4 TaxID=694430 RepID=L0K0W3_9EURY|nr:hypothetical protein [Natronococcus occultus]AGB37984.1 hypothetical protein Natoc_2205 [Natronococcus occultus SP4]
MERTPLTRRRFGAATVALATIGTAGCIDGDDGDRDDGDDETFDLEDPGTLTILLETEDGEPVSTDVEVTLRKEEEEFTGNYDDVEDGRIVADTLLYEGEYAVVAESTDGEFDEVEETVTVEEDEDAEVTLVLEGATPDTEVDDEELAADDEAA